MVLLLVMLVYVFLAYRMFSACQEYGEKNEFVRVALRADPLRIFVVYAAVSLFWPATLAIALPNLISYWKLIRKHDRERKAFEEAYAKASRKHWIRMALISKRLKYARRRAKEADRKFRRLYFRQRVSTRVTLRNIDKALNAIKGIV